MQKNWNEPEVSVGGDLKVPLYHQIFLILAAKITDGTLEDGESLPSEHEVAASFGVSRITATRAFRELAAAGLVVRGRGRGTRVKYDGGRTVVRGNVQGLAESRRINSRAGTQRVLSFEYVNAPRDVATALRTPVGTVVQKATRIMESGGQPFSHLTTYVPAQLGQKWTRDDLETHSLLSLMESVGATLERGEQRITAVLADSQMAPLLCVPVGSPLLAVVRTTFTTDDVPIEYLTALHPPERYQIYMTLDHDDDNQEVMKDVTPNRRRKKI
jgi:GntR family transcriptional regulator